MSNRSLPVLLLLAIAGACAPPPPPPVAVVAEEAPPPLPPFPSVLAWTARGDVRLLSDEGEIRIEHPFTRLNVLHVDSIGVRVRCLYCIPAFDGSLAREDVVHEPVAPIEAAGGTLAGFVLAVRDAVERRDQTALYAVMSSDFTSSLGGGGGASSAFIRWQWEGFRLLNNLPPLLDRGLATQDSVVWVAPPAFLTDPEYHGPRTGFRRNPAGRWEWVFLVTGG
jgi:hypothetical protein